MVLHGPDSLDDLTERGLAFSALLQGSARRVELAWLAEQAADAQVPYEAEPADAVDSLLDFPCTAGLALVLHPELVGTGWPLVPPLPDGEGTPVDEGVLGERGLAVLLGVDPLEPGGAQVGWEGDSCATYESDDGERCTAADVIMDTAGQRDRLLAALRGRAVEAAATTARALRLRACG